MVTPLQAIRKNCLICAGRSPKEVRLCPHTECPLWPFRFGKLPEKAKRGRKPTKQKGKEISK